MKTNEIEYIEELRGFLNENEDINWDEISIIIEKNGWLECNDDRYVCINPEHNQLLWYSDNGSFSVSDLSEEDTKEYIERYCK